jgi:replication factor A1
LVDNTNFSVKVTIWGAGAASFNAPPESVIAFKGVKVSDFGGRSLSLLSSGNISINPDVNEAHVLKGWYVAQGRNDQFMSHAGAGGSGDNTGRTETFKTIGAVKEEGLGMSEKGDYFSLRATVTHIAHENPAYPACSSENCQKKVFVTDEGWRCEKCEKTWPTPQWRYLMMVNVMDHTGPIRLNLFNDTAELLMGIDAPKLMELRESSGDGHIFTAAIGHTWNFRCRAKQETYNEQAR